MKVTTSRFLYVSVHHINRSMMAVTTMCALKSIHQNPWPYLQNLNQNNLVMIMWQAWRQRKRKFLQPLGKASWKLLLTASMEPSLLSKKFSRDNFILFIYVHLETFNILFIGNNGLFITCQTIQFCNYYNFIIFSGQTGSGKTFTMLGEQNTISGWALNKRSASTVTGDLTIIQRINFHSPIRLWWNYSLHDCFITSI